MDSQSPQDTPRRRAPAGVTVRAFVLGTLIVVLNNWWLSQSEMRSRQTLISGTTPFIGVIFIMFVLALLNWGVRRLYRPAALTQPELVIVYVMATISSCVGGVGAIGWFPNFLVYPFWAAIHDDKWEKFTRFVPEWFGPRREEILAPFYEGHSTFFTPAHLKVWAVPLALWGAFFFVLLFVTLCMAVLVRKQWIENERLNFPLVYLPVEMTRTDSPGFFVDRLMWLGFAIPLIIHSLNSLNAMYPVVPSAMTNRGINIGGQIVNAPWKGIGELTLRFHPSVLGIGYLLSLDVSLSCWVFFLLIKLIQVAGVAAGLRSPDTVDTDALEFPYTGQVSVGAWIMIALLALYAMRKHLAAVWRRAVHGDRSVDDSGEALSYRTALVGFVLGSGVLVAFCWFSGMTVLIPVLVLAIFFLIMVALSRIRAETGIPASELAWISPQDTLVDIFGAKSFDHRQLTAISLLGWFNKDYRTAAMPAQVEALKLGQMTRTRIRPLGLAMVVASLVAIAAAMIFSLNLYYTYGAETGKTYSGFVNAGKYNWDWLKGWWESPRAFNVPGAIAALTGAAVLVVLTRLRIAFVGFPLSPSAYCFAMTHTMKFFWFDFLAAWIVKGVILRYGGMRLYRRALPLFLGLILGEFVTSSFWTIVGAVTGLELYRTFPN